MFFGPSSDLFWREPGAPVDVETAVGKWAAKGSSEAAAGASEHQRGGELLRQRLYRVVLRLESRRSWRHIGRAPKRCASCRAKTATATPSDGIPRWGASPRPNSKPNTLSKNTTRDCPGNLKHLTSRRLRLELRPETHRDGLNSIQASLSGERCRSIGCVERPSSRFFLGTPFPTTR